MRKLFAWVLFFALIFGCYKAFGYLLERPEISTTYSNVKEGVNKTLGKLDEKQEKEPKNIVLKDTASEQVGSFYNEYNENWAMSHKSYSDFTLEMPNHDGGYITGNGRELFSMTIGQSSYEQVKKKLGKPLEMILKGHTKYTVNEKGKSEMLLYNMDGYYVTFFFDVHNKSKLRAIQYVKEDVEQKKPGFYAQASDDLRNGFEELMIELMNESRVEHNLKPLKFDKGLIAQAREHSQDMVDNLYFSHEGSDGSTPEKRMKAAGYTSEHLYAENLAYGQYSSIYAHEGLMNSLGHRENILNKDLEYAGVGVAFDANNTPYYTINFYTPF